eukprot:evm.model.scf_468.12 EVM.evm.TU.scf_468.12   scf_468:71324-72010(+)
MKDKSKSKQKKEERKRANEAATNMHKEVVQILAAAKQDLNPFDHFLPFQIYERRGLDLKLMHYPSDTLPLSLMAWCVKLCEENMRALYEPVWGWNKDKKSKQLMHPDSRFIVASRRSEPNEPLAYTNYRYEEEGGCPVLYVYELQVEKSVQRLGVGKFVMQLMELMARRNKMDAIMLTVLNQNTAGAQLYQKLGYVVDESSPSIACPWEECGYEILRKSLSAKSSQQG